LLRRSQLLLHGKRNSLWCSNTINKRSATSHLVDAILIVIVMPFAVQPKSSDGLFYLPHHRVNITKSLSMGIVGCPKGLHSTFFTVVSIIRHRIEVKRICVLKHKRSTRKLKRKKKLPFNNNRSLSYIVSLFIVKP